MPRAGIVIYRDEDGLKSARARYEIAKNASAKVKTEAIEDFLFKKVMEHFYPGRAEAGDSLKTNI